MNLTGLRKRLKALEPIDGQLWHIITPDGETWYRVGKYSNLEITEAEKQACRDKEAAGEIKVYKIKPALPNPNYVPMTEEELRIREERWKTH